MASRKIFATVKTVSVKAAPIGGGLSGKRRVPFEGSRHRFITEHEAVSVPLTAYYLRKISKGELVHAALPVADSDKTPASPDFEGASEQ